MINSFLFWFLLAGTILASLQDIKRREIDRWLNYTLLVGSIIYLTFNLIFTKNITILTQGIFTFAIIFLFSNLLYYTNFFAGGDSSLLFAISALFIGPTILTSTLNILSFIILLIFAGSIYGLIYSIALYIKTAKETNKEIKKLYKTTKTKYILLVSIPFFILSFLNIIFLSIAIILVLYPALFIFAKSLEKTALTKTISGKELRLGDWINEDIKVKGNLIKSDFKGINEKDIKLLKNKRKVTIKNGLPFAPSFTIAIILQYLFAEKVISTIFLLFM